MSFKVFTAMFMNTGLTILLVNAALQTICLRKLILFCFSPAQQNSDTVHLLTLTRMQHTRTHSVLVSIGIGNGDFADFSTAWYPKVGANICLAMFWNVVTPNILTWLRLAASTAAGGPRRGAPL